MREIEACQACPLHEQIEHIPGKRHLPVLGRGPMPAEVMYVGEGPGVEEADTGLEFVGRSGQLFDTLCALSVRAARAKCFVTNLVKHRPPKNRDPRAGEIKACRTFLDAQLTLVRPQVLITLGRVAAKQFDKSVKLEMDHGRGRRIEYAGLSLLHIPMYHPAAALRDAGKWMVMVEDFSKLDEVIGEGLVGADAVRPHYELATDEQAGQLALTSETLGFDLETTSPRKGKSFASTEAEIVGYSIAWADNCAVYVAGKPGPLVRAVLENPMYEKVCQNLKFEYGRMRALNIEIHNAQDTMLAAWLLQYHSIGLKALTRQILGRDPITYEQATQGRDMADIPAEEIAEYGAADSDNTRLIWPKLRRELHKTGLWEVYENIELPCVPILAEMEQVGVMVDEAEAVQVLAAIEQAENEAREKIYWEGLPDYISADSHDQLAAALEGLGAPITERTEVKEQLKTDEDSLLDARKQGWMPELVDAILDYRSMGKLRNYASQYLELRGSDGRLHSDFIQAGSDDERGKASSGPVTGRFSSRAPNLENQPKRKGGEWVGRLRRCIVPTPGYELIAADISQEEVRIAAYVTGESKLLAALERGESLYEQFAQGIYNRAIGKHSDPLEYNVGKQSVLSFIWGSGGKHSWSPRLVELDLEQGSGELTLAEAERAYARLDHEYRGIAGWRKQVRAQLREQGYVRDWFGRRRLIPKIYHPDRKVKQEGWREGMNFLIQAPAASVLKLAMQRVARAFKDQSLRARILIPIHDELVCEAPPSERAQSARILLGMTTNIMPIVLPVEVSYGRNWGEMIEYKVE